MNTDLSAFYVDIRKDALYCEPYSSPKRKAALETIEQIFRCTCVWLAPLMCFTAEEAWLARYPSEEGSVHLRAVPEGCRSRGATTALAEKWEKIKRVRRVVTGALEIERAAKKIGSSLEAAPQVFIADRRSDGGARRRRSGGGVHHVGHRGDRRRAARGRLHAATTWRASAWCRSRPRARSARAPGASPRTSAAIRRSPSCRRATRPPCASSMRGRA